MRADDHVRVSVAEVNTSFEAGAVAGLDVGFDSVFGVGEGLFHVKRLPRVLLLVNKIMQ